MTNLWCNLLILISTLLLGVLTFSKEIAKALHNPFIEKLGLKLLVLIFCIAIGTYGTIQKERNADEEVKVQENEVKIQTHKLDTLKSQFIKELVGGDFPLINAVITPDSSQNLDIYLSQDNSIPVNSISVTIYDDYGFAKSVHFNEKYLKNHYAVDSKFFQIITIPSLNSNNFFDFFEQDLTDCPLDVVIYTLRVVWRNGNYTGYVIVRKVNNKFSDIEIKYRYNKKDYTDSTFAAFAESKRK